MTVHGASFQLWNRLHDHNLHLARKQESSELYTKVSLPDARKCLRVSVHEILQARILEYAAMPSSRGSSQPRDQTQVSRTAGGHYHLRYQGSPGNSRAQSYTKASLSDANKKHSPKSVTLPCLRKTQGHKLWVCLEEMLKFWDISKHRWPRCGGSDDRVEL